MFQSTDQNNIYVLRTFKHPEMFSTFQIQLQLKRKHPVVLFHLNSEWDGSRFTQGGSR